MPGKKADLTKGPPFSLIQLRKALVVAVTGLAAFTAERAFDQMLELVSRRGNGRIDAAFLALHRRRRPASPSGLP